MRALHADIARSTLQNRKGTEVTCEPLTAEGWLLAADGYVLSGG
jgi:hypothetical protein